MTKKELAKAIADELGIPLLMAQDAVQKTLDGIIEMLTKRGRIELRNFGLFEVKRREPRTARNPRIGEVIFVPERVTISFKAGREMLEQVAVSDQATS